MMFKSTFSLLALALSALLPTTLASPITPLPSSPLETRSDWCTPETIQVRQDWSTLTPDQRKSYTDAVLCIMAQPSQLDQVAYPGAKNKFEDYAAIHIQRSLNIHLSGYFLTWHRMYLHLWYVDLKNTCGYRGPMPYWNWVETARAETDSAVFDGSPYSMSGDGLFVDTGPTVLGPNFTLPKGSGGGCVTTGPFANFTTTIAPIDVSVALSGGPLPTTAFDYVPACLTRDLNTYAATTFTTAAEVHAAVAAPDMATFSDLVNGNIPSDNLGLHLGAHFTVGGMASNLFSSPQDPIWYLMHAYLDKIYANWQTAHPDQADTVVGTMTFANNPPSDPVTPDTYQIDWDYLYPSVFVKELFNTTNGPFCYEYI